MTRYRYVLLFMFCMLLFPNASKAECSYERQAELSRIASNVQFSYNYEIDELDNLRFYVTITNITNDIYVVDKYGEVMSGLEVVKKYPNNSTLDFDIYSNDEGCRGDKLLSSYLTLPIYNPFSFSDDCRLYPDFKYCNFWGNTLSVSKEMFDSELEKYKKKSDSTFDKEEKKNFFQTVMEPIKDNYYIFIIFIIFILLVFLKKKMW